MASNTPHASPGGDPVSRETGQQPVAWLGAPWRGLSLNPRCGHWELTVQGPKTDAGTAQGDPGLPGLPLAQPTLCEGENFVAEKLRQHDISFQTNQILFFFQRGRGGSISLLLRLFTTQPHSPWYILSSYVELLKTRTQYFLRISNTGFITLSTIDIWDQIIMCCGATLCIVGCLVASLPPPNRCQQHTPVWHPKTSPDASYHPSEESHSPPSSWELLFYMITICRAKFSH